MIRGDTQKKENEILQILFTDLEFGDELGEGAFGSVYKGHWKSQNMDVAIKRIPGKINREEVSAVLLT